MFIFFYDVLDPLSYEYAPIIDRLAFMNQLSMNTNFEVYKLNCNKNSTVCDNFGIESFPSFKLFSIFNSNVTNDHTFKPYDLPLTLTGFTDLLKQFNINMSHKYLNDFTKKVHDLSIKNQESKNKERDIDTTLFLMIN